MTADIIDGPWKKHIKSDKELEQARVFAECDRIVSDCTITVLQNLVESGIAPDDPDDENITYILFLTELLKGVAYKSFNIEHPFQEIVALMCATEQENNSKNYYIDYNAVEDAISFLKNREKDLT